MRESDEQPSPFPTKEAMVLFGLLAEQHGLTGNEGGSAISALTFVQDALDCLAKGDYKGFLCAVDLAGVFAKDARKEYYSRSDT